MRTSAPSESSPSRSSREPTAAHQQIIQTHEERRQLWVFFWILYLLGPLMAVAAHLMIGTLLAALPAWLRPIARTTYEWFGIWAPAVGDRKSVV